MKLLLTSAGIKNTSIANALVEMLGKPIAEASALVIPTAAYSAGGPAAAWRIVSGRAMTPLCEIGWKSLGLLELTALPSIDAAQWIPIVRETDALLVGGGDPLDLAHWLQQSGAADVLTQVVLGADPLLRPRHLDHVGARDRGEDVVVERGCHEGTVAGAPEER